MTAHSSEIKRKLFDFQKGRSSFSGLTLDRGDKRLEIHHIKERFNGGDGSIANLQLLPIEEHLAIHFMRSRDENLPESERIREFDTVIGRLKELTDKEKINFYQFLEEKVGIKVRFI